MQNNENNQQINKQDNNLETNNEEAKGGEQNEE